MDTLKAILIGSIPAIITGLVAYGGISADLGYQKETDRQLFSKLESVILVVNELRMSAWTEDDQEKYVINHKQECSITLGKIHAKLEAIEASMQEILIEHAILGKRK